MIYKELCNLNIEDYILILNEDYGIKDCTCGKYNGLFVYGNGVSSQSKKYIDSKMSEKIGWQCIDVYMVECTHCGRRTFQYNNPIESVKAWNKDFIFLKGKSNKNDKR